MKLAVKPCFGATDLRYGPFLDRYCEQDVLVCASHFPSPSFGRVVREGNGFWFEYLKA